ncbi:MAG TPA: cytochrome c class I [Casimicrobiaceae bacterium]
MHPARIAAAVALVVAVPLAAQTRIPPPPPGRLLASNCFQCHGTDGRGGFEELAGKSANEIYSELKEMQRRSEANDLMVPHAKGYTDEQLRAIGGYFATVR